MWLPPPVGRGPWDARRLRVSWSADAGGPPPLYGRAAVGPRVEVGMGKPRFKVFSSASCGDDIGKLERMINDWLESAHPAIRHVAQSSLGTHLVVSFVFDDAGAHVAVAERAVAVPEVFEQDLRDAELDPMEIVILPEAELPY